MNSGSIAESILHSGYASITPVSASNNFIMVHEESNTHTYRTYLRPREDGQLKLRIWDCNSVDSTWDKGAVAVPGVLGGEWEIVEAFFGVGGKELSGSVLPGSQVAVTFDRELSRRVLPGERYWSDPVSLTIPKEHYLVFTWTLRTVSKGKTIPYNREQMLVTGYDAPGHHASDESAVPFRRSNNLLVLPCFIGYEKVVARKMVFLGDSVTQGVRTAADAYEYWVARIAEGLGPNYGVWNLGSGWARAHDAAQDRDWLYKAKQGDQILIALGINDIRSSHRSAKDIHGYLATIVSRLKEYNPQASIILFTIPALNFVTPFESVWRELNDRLKNRPPVGVDAVFDVSRLLSRPEPEDNLERPEYMSSYTDMHPNGMAGKVIADAFLAWYRK